MVLAFLQTQFHIILKFSQVKPILCIDCPNTCKITSWNRTDDLKLIKKRKKENMERALYKQIYKQIYIDINTGHNSFLVY